MDPHAVLGVGPSATEREIVRAFRRLALLHHPDRHGGSAAAAERFRTIKAAYDALRARQRATEKATSTPSERPTPSAWTSRALDRALVARVRRRLASLIDAARAAVAAPDVETLAHLVDAARWTRLEVDGALAFKGHVAELRDARWKMLRFTTPSEAREVLGAFVHEPASALDLIEMRNLRARLDGLLSVARGYEGSLRSTTTI